MICGTYFRGIVCTLRAAAHRGVSRRSIVATMELTEQRNLRHEYETARGMYGGWNAYPVTKLKSSSLTQPRCCTATILPRRSCRNGASWIDLSIIESRRSARVSPLRFLRLFLTRARPRLKS